MDKFCTKKVLAIIGLVIGIPSLIVSFTLAGNTSAFSSIDSLKSAATMLELTMILQLICGILIAVDAGIYYFQKDKDKFVLAYFISGCLLTLMMLGSSSLISYMHAIAQMNYSVISSGASSAYSAIGTLKAAEFVGGAICLYSIFILLAEHNIITINGGKFNVNTANNNQTTQTTQPQAPTQESVAQPVATPQEPEAQPEVASVEPTPVEPSTVAAEVNEPKVSAEPAPQVEKETIKPQPEPVKVNKGPSFFSTKNGKITLGIIGVVIIAILVVVVINPFKSYEKINLFKSVDVTFSGHDGNGYVYSYSGIKATNDYDGNDSNVISFLNSVTYQANPNNNLSNGDKVEIKAIYDESKLEDLGIKIVKDETSVKVSGLTAYYKKATDVPAKIVAEAKDDLEEYMDDEFDDDEYKLENTNRYFLFYYPNNPSATVFAGIYKVTPISNNNTTSTPRYVKVYYNGFNSDYGNDEKDGGYWYQSLLYGKGYSSVITSTDEAVEALKDYYEDYKASEFGTDL